jgi:hypothetical protein
MLILSLFRKEIDLNKMSKCIFIMSGLDINLAYAIASSDVYSPSPAFLWNAAWIDSSKLLILRGSY